MGRDGSRAALEELCGLYLSSKVVLQCRRDDTNTETDKGDIQIQMAGKLHKPAVHFPPIKKSEVCDEIEKRDEKEMVEKTGVKERKLVKKSADS